MKCNDPERGAVHTGLTDEQMREFVSSDPAVPGPHDANVSRIVRKGKLFRSDWFAHCNPVDGVVVLPSAAGLEAGEISRAAGKRKRHHVERPRGRSCGSRRRRRCSATGGRCTSSYG